MRRIQSILAVGAAAAAAILVAAGPAGAESSNPPPPATATRNCLTCPPDLIASVARYYEDGFPYWKVEVTNLGGQSSPSSTASVTYRTGLNINTASVTVPTLGGFQTRVVYVISALTNFVLSACADSLGDVAESNETNNCASPA